MTDIEVKIAALGALLDKRHVPIEGTWAIGRDSEAGVNAAAKRHLAERAAGLARRRQAIVAQHLRERRTRSSFFKLPKATP